MPTTSLPLSLVAQINVQIGAVAPAAPTFNQGLIVGNSPVIPNSERLRKYATLNSIQTDFGLNAPETKAATEYFAQKPAPPAVWIGLQDTTAIKTAAPSAPGQDYVVGDIVTAIQSSASGGTFRVTAIDSNGGITGLLQLKQGTGYSIATGVTLSGGSGTGAEIDISAVGETPLQSLVACRSVNGSWWMSMATAATDDDHLAIAAWMEAATPTGTYAAAVTDEDVLATLKSGAYGRTMAFYTTTQSGLAPNNTYGAAAVMGQAMGLNTGLANSYFTLKFKELVGITPEPLDDSDVTRIENLNGNLCLSYADNDYIWYEPGVMCNGQFFDEVLGLDMLASDIQRSIVNLYRKFPAITQNNTGQALELSAVNEACDRSRIRGFLSPGVWKGEQILKLQTGQALPLGYLSQSDSYVNQSDADRDARKSMPIYVSILESGAVHSVVIGVSVQR